jgi:hypothetical protein
MTGLNKKYLQILLAFFPLLLFAIVFLHKMGFIRTNATQAAMREHDLIVNWQKAEYEPIKNIDKISFAVRSSSRMQTNLLQKDQIEALGDSILNWIQCYSTNSFMHYKRFRFPVEPNAENSKWEPEMIDTYKKIIRATRTPLPATTGDEYKDNMALMELFYKIAVPMTDPRGRPTYCIACWDGVALSQIDIIIKKGPDADMSLSTMVWGDHNQSSSTFTGSIYYDPRPLKTDFTTAFVRLLIKFRPGSSIVANSSVTSYPVYLSLMWDPKDGCWLPDTFSAGIAQQAVFLF